MASSVKPWNILLSLFTVSDKLDSIEHRLDRLEQSERDIVYRQGRLEGSLRSPLPDRLPPYKGGP